MQPFPGGLGGFQSYPGGQARPAVPPQFAGQPGFGGQPAMMSGYPPQFPAQAAVMMGAAPAVPNLFPAGAPGPGVPPSVTPPEKKENEQEVVALEGRPYKMYLGRISPDTNDQMLKECLQLFGYLSIWRRTADAATGKMVRFGFAEFRKPESILRAVRVLNNLDLDGSKLLAKLDKNTSAQLEEYLRETHKIDKETPVDLAIPRNKEEEVEDALVKDRLLHKVQHFYEAVLSGGKKDDLIHENSVIAGHQVDKQKVTMISKEIDAFRVRSEHLEKQEEERRMEEVRRMAERARRNREAERLREQNKREAEQVLEEILPAAGESAGAAVEIAEPVSASIDKPELPPPSSPPPASGAAAGPQGSGDPPSSAAAAERERARRRGRERRDSGRDRRRRGRDEDERRRERRRDSGRERGRDRDRRVRERLQRSGMSRDDAVLLRYRDEEALAEERSKADGVPVGAAGDGAPAGAGRQVEEAPAVAEGPLLGKPTVFNLGKVATAKCTSLASVFGDLEDADESGSARKKIKLQPPPTSTPVVSELRSLVDRVPTGIEEIDAYEINWDLILEKKILEDKMQNYVTKQITELLGEKEQTMIDFVMDKLKQRTRAKAMIEELAFVLEEAAEQFVIKLWRLLIFEQLRLEAAAQ